ncbi:MAG: NADH:ubiquinone reductase (Na(+)-transporting) subunit B [Calditrichaeota bacterium]|nr:NADH:ubiquinone reductase (Na(+)-transporting) subunit B [Calditrichota bacterium]
MKILEDILINKIKPHFQKGGKFEKFFYAYDAHETLLFVPDHTTKSGAHIRDSFDSKRMMMTVVIALIPCLLFGIYNAGYQHFLSIGTKNPAFADVIIHGALSVIPILITAYAVGLTLEMVFAISRGHEVSEGFLVSGMLITLIVPPTIPLWQVAVATTFGVVIGLEVFGGTGMNVLNPALVTRAFIFFAYPAYISGDKVWTYIGSNPVDGYSGATPLLFASAKPDGAIVDALHGFGAGWMPGGYSFENMFYGLIPGSIGETSVIAILIGALILIITGVGSWRTMLSVVIGGVVMALIFNFAADQMQLPANHIFHLPPHYHLVMGGFMLGAVFMATDPVSSASTNMGKWIYGFMIGAMAVLIRSFNPAYPEGMMLSILFWNVFAPFIDHYVVQSNIKRRLARA